MQDTPSASASVRRPRRAARSLGKFLLGFLALIVVAILIENWRGHRAWNRYRAEWEARGERFDVEAFIPPPVSADQNFAMTPLLAPLLDFDKPRGQPIQWRDAQGYERIRKLGGWWQQDMAGRKKTPSIGKWDAGTFTDLTAWKEHFVGNTNHASVDAALKPADAVLAALKEFDAPLVELESASARPFAAFPIRHHDHMNMLLPHLAMIKGVSQAIQIRAVAELVAGKKAEAVREVKIGLRLVDSLKVEPLLISHLVRVAMIHVLMAPIWEGLARGDWNEAQLAELQTALTRVRILEDYAPTMRGERALNMLLLDELASGKMREAGAEWLDGDVFSLSRFLPGGWFARNKMTLSKVYQEYCIPVVDTNRNAVNMELARLSDATPELEERGIYNVFARMLYPAISKSVAKFARGQTLLNLATIGCALERHRLAHGKYPGTLDLLVPQFLPKLPNDVITGEPLKYRVETDGAFTLYSVGWNATDDHGTVKLTKNGGTDVNSGDWVWTYPAR